YRSGSREELLRRWLLMRDPPFRTLGCFTGDVPKYLESEFRQLWATRITESAGLVVDDISPWLQPGMKWIAIEAYETFRHRPRWLTQRRLRKIAPFLSTKSASELAG